MTVTTEIREKSSACNGATTRFDVGFQFAEITDLFVELLDQITGASTTLTEGTDFVLSGTPMAGDAQITTTVAYPLGQTLRRTRMTARTQETVYTPNDGFPAKSHEAALDKLTLIVQEIAGDLISALTRALLLPEGEAVDPLPNATARANKVLGFDNAGKLVLFDATSASAVNLGALVSGLIPFALPDEALGQAVPDAGSGLPYLSGGILKIA